MSKVCGIQRGVEGVQDCREFLHCVARLGGVGGLLFADENLWLNT